MTTASIDKRISAPRTGIRRPHRASGPRLTTVGVHVDTPLQMKLLTMLHDGQVPMCGYDPDLWTSDVRAEREHAAGMCIGCPLLSECAADADSRREAWGVWGGRDRTLRATRTAVDA